MGYVMIYMYQIVMGIKIKHYLLKYLYQDGNKP